MAGKEYVIKVLRFPDDPPLYLGENDTKVAGIDNAKRYSLAEAKKITENRIDIGMEFYPEKPHP